MAPMFALLGNQIIHTLRTGLKARSDVTNHSVGARVRRAAQRAPRNCRSCRGRESKDLDSCSFFNSAFPFRLKDEGLMHI